MLLKTRAFRQKNQVIYCQVKALILKALTPALRPKLVEKEANYKDKAGKGQQMSRAN